QHRDQLDRLVHFHRIEPRHHLIQEDQAWPQRDRARHLEPLSPGERQVSRLDVGEGREPRELEDLLRAHPRAAPRSLLGERRDGGERRAGGGRMARAAAAAARRRSNGTKPSGMYRSSTTMKRPNSRRCISANRAQSASATAVSNTPPRSGPQTVPAPPKM